MKIIESVQEMQDLSSAARREGRTIAFVPTMGFLHEGHASLLREGRRRGDFLVLSIFVNPTQFGVGEDFETYPRDMERDSRVAAEAGVDVIFAPSAREMYPPGYQTFVDVEKLTGHLCGASRPGHFRGVTTVVSKLFNIVKPHTAFFGQKDYQQLAVIRRMAVDLNMDVEVVGMPIVREADGLAMSSRNSYLSPSERQSALCLSRALAAAKACYHGGERGAAAIREVAVAAIAAEPAAAIDYVELRHGDTLEDIAVADNRSVLALAVRIGTTRLIDNCLLGEDT
jgi:pantoate--beta-alanine ligase